MSTITAILEANADGTLHLPLPAELRHGKVKVEAKLESVEAGPDVGKMPRARHIDQLVHELYAFTPEEIAVVQGGQ